DHVAEARSDRVNEHQIGAVERAERIVDDMKRPDGRWMRWIVGGNAAWTEGAHVNPERGGTRAAVEDEQDGAGCDVSHALAHVGEGKQGRSWRTMRVRQHRVARVYNVGDGRTSEHSGVRRDKASHRWGRSAICGGDQRWSEPQQSSNRDGDRGGCQS